MNDHPEAPAVPARHPLAFLWERRLPMWVSLVLVLLIAIVFVWSRLSIGAAESRLEKERQELTQKYEAQRVALLERTWQASARQDDEAQRRFGTALAWAVRAELIRNNLDQVDQFFNAIARMERVKRVVLASQEGKVLLASDKRYQGGEFTALYDAALLATPQVSVLAGPDGDRRLVLPIMGITARLGTVVLDYDALPPPSP